MVGLGKKAVGYRLKWKRIKELKNEGMKE